MGDLYARRRADRAGMAVNPEDKVQIAFEVFGREDAERTIVFLPTWSLVHSRCWKMQVPYFARQGFRVVTYDGRGNGKSGRPKAGYSINHFTQDMLAVFDTVGIDRADVVGLSAGGGWGVQFAAEHPERLDHLILIAPSVRLSGQERYPLEQFLAEPPDYEGWNKYNASYWRRDYRGFAEWFISLISSVPHSTKGIDDAVGWALETTPEVLIATVVESVEPRMAEFAASVRCSTLIIHGSDDQNDTFPQIQDLHEAINGSKLSF